MAIEVAEGRRKDIGPQRVQSIVGQRPSTGHRALEGTDDCGETEGRREDRELLKKQRAVEGTEG
jgi:hypothetical protein